jgi:hypothetical protein
MLIASAAAHHVMAAEEAAYIAEPRLLAFQIGNEPGAGPECVVKATI